MIKVDVNNYHKLRIFRAKRNNRHGGSGQRVWKVFHGQFLVGFSPLFLDAVFIAQKYKNFWQTNYKTRGLLGVWNLIICHTSLLDQVEKKLDRVQSGLLDCSCFACKSGELQKRLSKKATETKG